MLFRKGKDESTHVADRSHAEEKMINPSARNTVNAQRDVWSSNPGPQNSALASLSPNSNIPPPTDHGSVGSIWHSFELTHRRVQEGGWSHQVTERELPLSKFSSVELQRSPYYFGPPASCPIARCQAASITRRAYTSPKWRRNCAETKRRG